METENIKLSKQLVDSIRAVIKKTKLYQDEEDFVNQAIIKQISKYK